MHQRRVKERKKAKGRREERERKKRSDVFDTCMYVFMYEQ